MISVFVFASLTLIFLSLANVVRKKWKSIFPRPSLLPTTATAVIPLIPIPKTDLVYPPTPFSPPASPCPPPKTFQAWPHRPPPPVHRSKSSPPTTRHAYSPVHSRSSSDSSGCSSSVFVSYDLAHVRSTSNLIDLDSDLERRDARQHAALEHKPAGMEEVTASPTMIELVDLTNNLDATHVTSSPSSHSTDSLILPTRPQSTPGTTPIRDGFDLLMEKLEEGAAPVLSAAQDHDLIQLDDLERQRMSQDNTIVVIHDRHDSNDHLHDKGDSLHDEDGQGRGQITQSVSMDRDSTLVMESGEGMAEWSKVDVEMGIDASVVWSGVGVPVEESTEVWEVHPDPDLLPLPDDIPLPHKFTDKEPTQVEKLADSHGSQLVVLTEGHDESASVAGDGSTLIPLPESNSTDKGDVVPPVLIPMAVHKEDKEPLQTPTPPSSPPRQWNGSVVRGFGADDGVCIALEEGILLAVDQSEALVRPQSGIMDDSDNSAVQSTNMDMNGGVDLIDLESNEEQSTASDAIVQLAEQSGGLKPENEVAVERAALPAPSQVPSPVQSPATLSAVHTFLDQGMDVIVAQDEVQVDQTHDEEVAEEQLVDVTSEMATELVVLPASLPTSSPLHSPVQEGISHLELQDEIQVQSVEEPIGTQLIDMTPDPEVITEPVVLLPPSILASPYHSPVPSPVPSPSAPRRILPSLSASASSSSLGSAFGGLRPAWSLRAADAPPLGLPSALVKERRKTEVGREQGEETTSMPPPGSFVDGVKVGPPDGDDDKLVMESSLGSAALDTSPSSPALRHPQSSTSATSSSTADVVSSPDLNPAPTPAEATSSAQSQTPAQTHAETQTQPQPLPLNLRPGGRLRVRSPLDIALAMQLRPGLGVGADPAWLVRFLMAMFGWFAVLMGGGEW